MISFTGSTLVGHRVAEVATAGLKRLHLELGGKARSLCSRTPILRLRSRVRSRPA